MFKGPYKCQQSTVWPSFEMCIDWLTWMLQDSHWTGISKKEYDDV